MLNHFAQLADESDEVPNLKGKSYSNFYLHKRDWDRLKLVHEILKVCWPLTITRFLHLDLALDALIVLGHAEIFQGIPKFDRMF